MYMFNDAHAISSVRDHKIHVLRIVSVLVWFFFGGGVVDFFFRSKVDRRNIFERYIMVNVILVYKENNYVSSKRSLDRQRR